MRRLTGAEVEHARLIPGNSALLFLTDRCPVGCAHCSVDSRRDSPSISDFWLLEEIVAGLIAMRPTTVVGISGGEPFVARRGLTMAADTLAGAGKLLVIYTSGVWAVSADVPRWATDVLARASCVYLSTDAFHAAHIDDATFVRAARAIQAAGPWIVTQVAGSPAQAEQAELLLATALGTAWRDYAEVRHVPLLSAGRAASRASGSRTHGQPAAEFGTCRLAAAPVVRYDGWVSACCNETVIMRGGPARLRRRVTTARELTAALTEFADDHYLRAIGTAGTGALTALHTYRDLSTQRFAHICELCFQLSARQPAAADEAILTLLSQRGPA